MKSKTAILILSIAAYLAVKHFVPYGPLLLYPLILLVTFLHELGHAVFALMSGGSVHGLQINPDGSGHAQIGGGWIGLVSMGGYVGSALFGNLLLFIGLAKEKWARVAPVVLSAAFVYAAVWWYQRLFTSIVLFLFAGGWLWMSRRFLEKMAAALVFVGSTSVLYIIEDISSGPMSDLAVFTAQLPFLPLWVWAALWLLLVLMITTATVKRAFQAARTPARKTHPPQK
ncbi:MAG: M50 family metallopeptidase [Deltaproteobacteria bacterium]|nr:M50 family metallopeptidase [Deltaproteobacteria bacterium]MBN2673379.1 M50 family metallopeptidase [Deltaproteobacteria bacterium]